MIQTHDDALKSTELLAAWKALKANKAWQEEFLPAIEEASATHLDGLRNTSATAEKRSEHVWASHLADRLKGMADDEIQRLREELQQFTAREGDIAREVMEEVF